MKQNGVILHAVASVILLIVVSVLLWFLFIGYSNRSHDASFNEEVEQIDEEQAEKERYSFSYDREKCDTQFAESKVQLRHVQALSDPINPHLANDDLEFRFYFEPQVDYECSFSDILWYLVYGRDENPTWDENHFWYVKSGKYTGTTTTVRDLDSGIWHFRVCALIRPEFEKDEYDPGACLYSEDVEVKIP